MIPPTFFRQVAIDPSSVGLAGAVGDVVGSSDCLTAWVKYGPNATDWQAFPVGAANAATAGLLAAADFSKLATVPSGAGVIPAVYTTPLVDFMAAAATYNLNTPLQAGKLFMPLLFRVIFLTRVGTSSTGLTYRWTQNGVSLDLAASPISTAVINGNTAPFYNFPAPNILMPDMTSFPLQAKITTPVAGTSACTGYFQLTGHYV